MVHSACLVPPGSENMANDHEGSPGTWETLPSPSKCRPETRLTNSRWNHGPVSWAVGDERGTQRWYRQAKETKCGERDVRESQHLIVPLQRGNQPEEPRQGTDLWPQLFSDVSCIALWISSEKILTRLYSVLHWFHKRLEVNVKNPREKRCFQIIIVFSFGSVDNSNKCTLLWKIAARLITVSTSVNNEMWVKLRSREGGAVS